MLFVGCHTGDQVTHTWRIPPLETEVVQIDIDPLELGRSYPNTLGLMGDPKATLVKLIAAIGKPTRDSFVRRPCRRHGRGLARGTRTAADQQCRADPGPIGCAPKSPAHCREDGILVADTGYSGIWTRR